MEIRFWVWIVGSLESSAPWKQAKTQEQKQKFKHPCGGGFRTSIYTYKPVLKAEAPRLIRSLLQGGGRTKVAGKAGQGSSYRAVIGFCCKRLLQGLGCTEGASWLLSCGEGCFIELEQHTCFIFLRRGRIFCASDFFQELASFLGGGEWQAKKKKTWRSRIWGASGLSGDLATQNVLPGFFSVVRDSL